VGLLLYTAPISDLKLSVSNGQTHSKHALLPTGETVSHFIAVARFRVAQLSRGEPWSLNDLREVPGFATLRFHR
jgi:hypothetical protein